VTAEWEKILPRPLVVEHVRQLVAEVRREVAEGASPLENEAAWDRLLDMRFRRVAVGLLGPVINATGVVLHTNLGRAPLSREAVQAVAQAAGGYINLEMDMESGERGSRHRHCQELLTLLTGAEAALVVNNGAAAILLVLSALAAGKEVIISRGQLIEIGGSFRIPDVLAQSGCRLVEVGTTNRTHLHDYRRAINENTGALLKVHTSNYQITGFTSTVAGRELAALAAERGLLFIEDLGSGVLLPTEKYGLCHEPAIGEVLAEGADIVTCSGDKLLGGPQCGLILGRKELLEACKKHPLARALRVGKLTLVALQATLLHYLRGEAEEKIPIWKMCSQDNEEIAVRAAAVMRYLGEGVAGQRVGQAAGQVGHCSLLLPHLCIETIAGRSPVGGGSLPGETLPTTLISISDRGHGRFKADKLAAVLRTGRPPVVARVEEGRLLIDLRTVLPEQDKLLAEALTAALSLI